MNLNDLPDRYKAQAAAQLGEDVERKQRTSQRKARGGGTWQCRDCGEKFPTDVGTERHTRTARHYRYELIFD